MKGIISYDTETPVQAVEHHVKGTNIVTTDSATDKPAQPQVNTLIKTDTVAASNTKEEANVRNINSGHHKHHPKNLVANITGPHIPSLHSPQRQHRQKNL